MFFSGIISQVPFLNYRKSRQKLAKRCLIQIPVSWQPVMIWVWPWTKNLVWWFTILLFIA